MYFSLALKLSLIRLQRRVLWLFKNHWQKMMSLVLLATMAVSGFLFFQTPETLGATFTYTWLQTDWSAGADTINFPIHPANQTDWARFYSKEAGVIAGAELSLFPTFASVVQTLDTDFNVGTFVETAVIGTGAAARVELALAPLPFLSGYATRKPIAIDNTTIGSTALTNYQVPVMLDTASLITAGKMRLDCGDIRFTDSDGITKIPYWIEAGCNTALTKIWARVPLIPAGVITTIYLYYDNPTAIYEGDGGAVFDFFDDFSGASLDAIKWFGSANSYSVSDGILRINTGGIGLQSALPFNIQEGYIVEARTLFNVLASGYSGTIPQISSSRFTMSGNAAADANILFMRELNEPDIYFFGGTGATASYDLGYGSAGWISTENTWYRTGISAAGGTVRLWRDGINIHTLSGITWWKNLGFFALGAWHGAADYDIQDTSYDWIRVRKHTDISPIVNLSGIEETLTHRSFGEFTSSAIDTGQASKFTTLGFAITEPVGADVKFQLRTATTTAGLAAAIWHGPAGTTDYYIAAGTVINPIHNGHRWIQYKAFFSTTDTLVTPILSEITINYQFYPVSASLISPPYNTGDALNVLAGISWTETLPAGTEIKFQVRTASDSGVAPGTPGTWTVWAGPDDGAGIANTTFSSAAFFTDPTGKELIDADMRDELNDQWIQYKVWLETTDSSITPILSDVALVYKDIVPLPPPPITKVILHGRAHLLSSVTILQDGRVVDVTTADSSAIFRVEIIDIAPGIWTFGIWAEDKRGVRSITHSFTTKIRAEMTTTIGGIFLPPTIGLERTRLQKGETLNILGQTVPGSEVNIFINSPEQITRKTQAGIDGIWFYAFDTALLEEGSHTARSRAISPEGLLSAFSQALVFDIGEGTKETIKNADISRDEKVNLIDFSILLYNWGTPKNLATDLNGDDEVNLTDFSIMMFYWTG